MITVSFNGCFGWLHRPSYGLAAEIGVLLCTGLSQDASGAHRPFRQLANNLADAGYPTVRFDYPGTGDSLDLDGREPWQAWQQSVHEAAEWMRTTVGVRQIVLVGLRFGAMLSAVVAEQRDDVVGLILLEPVLRGRSYISQLSIEAKLRSGVPADGTRGIELGDLVLDPDSMRLMQAVDLINIRPSAGCRTVIYTRAQTAALSSRAEAWQMSGFMVDCQGFEGLEAFLRPSHQTDEPDGDYSRIVCWLNEALSVQWKPAVHETALPSAAMHGEGWIETPLRFGAGGQLFGMLCRPDDALADLVVVIGNSGGNPHHGFARFSVELARCLARNGIASLRIDFAGLGDSEARENGVELVTQVFEVDRSSDMSRAVDALARLGYRRFVAYGLCSGAYHALHAALADSRFAAAVSVNLPWISLRPERPGQSSNSQMVINEVVRRGMYLLLLSAESDSGVKGLEKHFGHGCTGLAIFPTITVVIVPGLDHDLTTAPMRSTATNYMLDFLKHVVAHSHHVTPQQECHCRPV